MRRRFFCFEKMTASPPLVQSFVRSTIVCSFDYLCRQRTFAAITLDVRTSFPLDRSLNVSPLLPPPPLFATAVAMIDFSSLCGVTALYLSWLAKGSGGNVVGLLACQPAALVVVAALVFPFLSPHFHSHFSVILSPTASSTCNKRFQISHIKNLHLKILQQQSKLETMQHHQDQSSSSFLLLLLLMILAAALPFSNSFSPIVSSSFRRHDQILTIATAATATATATATTTLFSMSSTSTGRSGGEGDDQNQPHCPNVLFVECG